jgi:D-amino peptidase
VGQHAKAGTPYSHLTHTGWPNVIDYRINDLSVGEYGQLALCAMELGIPTILACGEKALCEEAEALTPGVITVSVKQGLLPDDGFRNSTMEEYETAKLSALHISPSKAVKLIREGALKAINKLKAEPDSFHYPKLSPPYRTVVEYRAYTATNTGAFTQTTEHHSSIIELMNTPLKNIKE